MGLFDGTELEQPVLCEQCSQDVKTCDCEPIEQVETEAEVPPEKQSVRVRLEKRKRGKLMTVIFDFRGPAKQRRQFLTDIKNHCGAGGTIAEGNVEVQGDHVERITAFLLAGGYRVR